MTTPPTPPASRPRLGWHLVLLAIIGAELLAAWALHRPNATLREWGEAGTPSQKVFAFHVLANRDKPALKFKKFTERALGSDEPLVRELALTTNFTRLRGIKKQREYVDELPPGPERTRAEILLFTRVGGGRELTMERLREFYATLEPAEPGSTPASTASPLPAPDAGGDP